MSENGQHNYKNEQQQGTVSRNDSGENGRLRV
jgi:hypothetical protein